MGFLTSKLYSALMTGAATLLLAGFIVQSVRIDGFPLFGPGLRGQLAECQALQGKANEAAKEAADKKFEEGRQSAAADATKLAANDQVRRDAEAAALEAIRAAVANLRRPPPPIVVPGAAPPPVVLTPPPPLPAACKLNQEALDAMSRTINAGRVRP